MVVLGAIGDLARKKLWPSLHRLWMRGSLEMPVLGVASTPGDDEALRAHVRSSTQGIATRSAREAPGLVATLGYVAGDDREPATFATLARRLEGATHPLCYLAVPPALFAEVVGGLASEGLARGGRVVVEKPFGRDLASAQELNRLLHESFPEEAIFRIDHYLGKELFRQAGGCVRPVLRRGLRRTSGRLRAPARRCDRGVVLALRRRVRGGGGVEDRRASAPRPRHRVPLFPWVVGTPRDSGSDRAARRVVGPRFVR